MLERMWRRENPPTPLVGMWIGTVTMENSIKLPQKAKNKITIWGLPWYLSTKESACQCSRHRFDPWSRKIPHATEQLSPCATTTESFKNSAQPINKIIELPYDPAIPFLGIQPATTLIPKDAHMHSNAHSSALHRSQYTETI